MSNVHALGDAEIDRKDRVDREWALARSDYLILQGWTRAHADWWALMTENSMRAFWGKPPLEAPLRDEAAS